jgi:hypothetical protein
MQARVIGPTGRTGQPVRTIVKVSRPRYSAKPEWHDGMHFGSQAELRRYKDLKLMQAAGDISGLAIHPRYDLYVCGQLLGYIELDFEYLDHRTDKMVYEDVKDAKKNSSTRTPIYRWKRLHLRAEHGIDIREVS